MDFQAVKEAAERLKSGLLAIATDGDYEDRNYQEDLRVLLQDNRVSSLLPSSIKANPSTKGFQRVMRAKYAHYSERRDYIEHELQPLFEYLEKIITGNNCVTSNLDSYELGECIGNGGFGTVYKYRHKLVDHIFAIKIFEPVFVLREDIEDSEKRFFREASILFSLNHESIVRVYDVGRFDGKPFIRMEYVDGSTLQELIAKNGPVSFERTKKPIIALLNGLKYAHSAGVIHRDLKPSNVMVSKTGTIKIIDFGVSAYLENENHSRLTRTGSNVANGIYNDPILMDNPKLRDVRSDIYSVGAIWCYLLTGRAPAGADIRSVVLGSNNVTELQCSIVLKCLALSIENRYQKCDDILEIIQPKKAIPNSMPIMPYSRLTDITRTTVCDYFLDRCQDDLNKYVHSQSGQLKQPERVFYYSGKRDDVTFLGQLYDLKSMPSGDSRCSSFEQEIIQHTINNYDYEYGWVFHDERLELMKGNDEVLLKFLSKMFDPTIRSEKSDWQSALSAINGFLKEDGYEIFESGKISGRSVYSYRYIV